MAFSVFDLDHKLIKNHIYKAMGNACCGMSREERAFSRGYDQAMRDSHSNPGQSSYYEGKMAQRALEKERKRNRRRNNGVIAAMAAVSS